MSDALSAAQFGPQQATPLLPAQPHYATAHTFDTPLPFTEHTDTSAHIASAWRKPDNGPLPYMGSTAGSTFRPFDA